MQLARPPITSATRGFTLIELSIVLVIIGLIVGGILVGQDLIKAAEIRAQVSQIEKYSTSVNAFRMKYGYLPGDMPPTRASQLGFFAESGPSAGTRAHQDGNSRIETMLFPATAGEILGFWRQLSDAQMIDGNFGTTASGYPLDAATGGLATATVKAEVRHLLPPAKIGRGNHVVALYLTTSNIFFITGITAIGTWPNGISMVNAITPVEAQNIDAKLDDGFPLTGKVIHSSFVGGSCVTGTAYDVGSTNGNVPNCALALQAQW